MLYFDKPPVQVFMAEMMKKHLLWWKADSGKVKQEERRRKGSTLGQIIFGKDSLENIKNQKIKKKKTKKNPKKNQKSKVRKSEKSKSKSIKINFLFLKNQILNVCRAPFYHPFLTITLNFLTD